MISIYDVMINRHFGYPFNLSVETEETVFLKIILQKDSWEHTTASTIQYHQQLWEHGHCQEYIL
jgi:hypothetical protein